MGTSFFCNLNSEFPVYLRVEKNGHTRATFSLIAYFFLSEGRGRDNEREGGGIPKGFRDGRVRANGQRRPENARDHSEASYRVGILGLEQGLFECHAKP